MLLAGVDKDEVAEAMKDASPKEALVALLTTHQASQGGRAGGSGEASRALAAAAAFDGAHSWHAAENQVLLHALQRGAVCAGLCWPRNLVIAVAMPVAMASVIIMAVGCDETGHRQEDRRACLRLDHRRR